VGEFVVDVGSKGKREELTRFEAEGPNFQP
jgi:hypothetical protein